MEHLPQIVARGRLMLTESNISLKRAHAGPPVVWFTTHETAEAGHGLKFDPTFENLHDWAQIDKTRIRITVDLPKSRVTKFVHWAKSQGASAETLAELATLGGLYSWWVSTQMVTMDRWVEIRDMQDTSKDPEGRVLWFREGEKQSTQVNFRQLLEKHGRPVEKGAQKRKIRSKTKAGKK